VRGGDCIGSADVSIGLVSIHAPPPGDRVSLIMLEKRGHEQGFS